MISGFQSIAGIISSTALAKMQIFRHRHNGHKYVALKIILVIKEVENNAVQLCLKIPQYWRRQLTGTEIDVIKVS